MKRGFPATGLIVLGLLTLSACAVPGSYVSSSVNGVEKTYRYDEGGKKVLVYEIDRTGNLIVHDPNDKRAKQRMTGQQWEKDAETAQAARLEKVKKAPKRKPNDPIFVNFKHIDDSAIQLTEKQKQDIYDYFRKQFENDSVIRLNAEEKSDRKGVRRSAANTLKDLSGKGHTADADIVIKVTNKTVYGTINGKLAEAKQMTFQATVNGNWMKDIHKAEDAGTLFAIPQATQRLSEKVKEIIKNDIGPTIPADRSL